MSNFVYSLISIAQSTYENFRSLLSMSKENLSNILLLKEQSEDLVRSVDFSLDASDNDFVKLKKNDTRIEDLYSEIEIMQKQIEQEKSKLNEFENEHNRNRILLANDINNLDSLEHNPTEIYNDEELLKWIEEAKDKNRDVLKIDRAFYEDESWIEFEEFDKKISLENQVQIEKLKEDLSEEESQLTKTSSTDTKNLRDKKITE